MPNTSSPRLHQLNDRAIAIVSDLIGPNSSSVDDRGEWPEEGMRALASAGLTGLTAPTVVGGAGQGLIGLATITETIGKGCASTALCFGMHCVATAVIAAKSSRFHEETYLAPIARGEHLTTLALSESGTGAHFFLPETDLTEDGSSLKVSGRKQFVTNGTHADSYVVSTRASLDSDNGDFSCVIVDRDTAGMQWGEPWRGFGMRGNDSRGLQLNNVRIPPSHLLGEQGDQVWYVFEVARPISSPRWPARTWASHRRPSTSLSST